MGNQAFFGCTRLASITIPNSVTSIGTSVFQGCSGLTTAVIGNNVGSIGNQVFHGNGSLASVTIGSSVTSIGNSAFQNCSTLTSITLPEGVISIGNDAFHGCTKLASINIPNSVTSIGTSAFRNSGITSIVFPENLTSIANNTFLGCTDLTTVTFPPNLLSIGSMAFANSGLTSVTIPNTVTTVGGNAFANSNLSSVVIGSGVTELNHFHFSGNANLISMEAVPENPVFSSIDGVLFNKDQTTLALFPPGKKGIYAIPDGTTSSEQMAFYGCSLTVVIIPNSVTSLGGNGIFGGCNSLTSIVSLNPVPPTVVGEPHGLNQSNVDVYVLPGSISAYEQAEWWRGSEWTNFKSISSAYQTLTFDSQGGSAVAPQDVIIFSKAESPANPTHPDFPFFAGWFRNADINISVPLPPIVEWDFDSDIVTGEITLYAKWSDVTSINSGVGSKGSPEARQLASSVQTYYDLKGTPLGTTKPTAPGVYLEKHGKHMRKIAVR
ncbi:MAG: leucine-rich repeat protein [Fibromonadaceae bacterium]|nr:leucine-rich repeat protein [Fibromonadaceae bacterium]